MEMKKKKAKTKNKNKNPYSVVRLLAVVAVTHDRALPTIDGRRKRLGLALLHRVLAAGSNAEGCHPVAVFVVMCFASG